MSAAPDLDWEFLEDAVAKAPKERKVYASLYQTEPYEAAVPRIPIIRRNDKGQAEPELLEQVTDHLERVRGLRGRVKVKIAIRASQKQEFGGREVTMVLRAPSVEDAARVNNPEAPAAQPAISADLNGLKQRILEAKEAKKLVLGECKTCREPKDECECPRCDGCAELETQCRCEPEKDCETCGLPESDCLCDEEESTLDLVAREVLTGPGAEELRDVVVDFLRGVTHRIRHGRTPPPRETEVERSNVTLLKKTPGAA